LEELIAEQHERLSSRLEGVSHVLVIQDSSEFNFGGNDGNLRVSDPALGVLSDNRTTGFLYHGGLVVDASRGLPLGFSGSGFWVRRFDREDRHSRRYKSQPIEEKESYKWIQSGEAAKEQLSDPSLRITILGDREADIYELFCRLPDTRTDVVIRCEHDRLLSSGEKVKQKLRGEEVSGCYTLGIRNHRSRSDRNAQLNIRYAEVELTRPVNRNQAGSPDPQRVQLWGIWVEEDPQTVPPNEAAIQWYLLTSHPVSSFEDALQIIHWYKQRWLIEEVFRILKQQGLGIEQSRLNQGLSLQKLAILCLDEALDILLLKQQRLGKDGLEADFIFLQPEVQFLQLLAQADPDVGKIPFSVNSLAWAAWIIARLGGWKDKNIEKKPPGVISFARGIKEFRARFEGYNLALSSFKNLPRPPGK
jgi:hypothetical protein